jgi:hypothetical protein
VAPVFCVWSLCVVPVLSLVLGGFWCPVGGGAPEYSLSLAKQL